MNQSRRKLIKYLAAIGAISGVSALTYAKFSPTTLSGNKRPHLVIIGLGSYGIALSNYLRRFVSNIKITVIDKNRIYTDHFKQSLYLARGIVKKTVINKEQMMQLDYQSDNQFFWFEDQVLAIDPNQNQIQTEKNGIIKYDALVLCCGLETIATQGLNPNEKMGSFYLGHETTQNTFVKIRDILSLGGHIDFYHPDTPSSRSYFYENILLTKFLSSYYVKGDFSVYTAQNSLHPINLYNYYLIQEINYLNSEAIKTNYQFNDINQDNKQIIFSHKQSYESIDYDYLCYVPKMQAPSFSSVLQNKTTGLVAVDPNSLKHSLYDNIFALGDVADLAVEKSLSSISEQVACVAQNLIDYFNNQNLSAYYDGSTTLAISTSKNRAFYWQRNYQAINENPYFFLETTYPTKKQKTALTSVLKTKYYFALRGFLI